MFEMNIDLARLQREVREFETPQNDKDFDEMLKWLEERNHVAVLRDGSKVRCTLMPAELNDAMDDVSHANEYLPHWELKGFAVEDMPVFRDLLCAANEDFLMDNVWDLLLEAPSPSGKPDVRRACEHVRSMLDCLREYEYDSCDSKPVVFMPLAVFDGEEKDSCVKSHMEARLFSLAAIKDADTSQAKTRLRYWWHDTLGYKVWFGGVSIRDSYQAIAWIVCKIFKESMVDRGIWMGDMPEKPRTEAFCIFKRNADENLRERMRDLNARLVPLEKLETITLTFDDKELEVFEALCRQQGLSMQNALHIALLRCIAHYSKG